MNFWTLSNFLDWELGTSGSWSGGLGGNSKEGIAWVSEMERAGWEWRVCQQSGLQIGMDIVSYKSFVWQLPFCILYCFPLSIIVVSTWNDKAARDGNSFLTLNYYYQHNPPFWTVMH